MLKWEVCEVKYPKRGDISIKDSFKFKKDAQAAIFSRLIEEKINDGWEKFGESTYYAGGFGVQLPVIFFRKLVEVPEKVKFSFRIQRTPKFG